MSKIFSLKPDEICFVGDDTVDIELLKYVGLSVIVPNSNPMLKKLDFRLDYS
jgi:hydroxymethylpyrimidine pyrophosphatase-like HAD family hydrolase